MEQPSEPRILVLSPVTDTKWIQEAQEVDADCGHRCWMAPGSLKQSQEPGTITVCVPCFGGNEAVAEKILSGEFHIPDPRELAQALLRELRGP